jgi:hypothetical protein
VIENVENIDELLKEMKMRKFLPVAAILIAGITAIATAYARGGWDGNGLSVSGFDLCSLGEKQIKDCPPGIEVPNK